MRVYLQHIDTIKNAKLLLHAQPQKFLCDPSHRIKVTVKDLFGLALMSKTKLKYEKIAILRLKNTKGVG